MVAAIDIIHHKATLREVLQKPVSQGNLIPALDLYSTLQEIERRCINDAPIIFAMNVDGFAEIKQACCHSWNCPRCGEMRAKQEYGRIVNGAISLSEAGHTLFFFTLTCQGKELSLEEAEIGYYTWTNKLLQACRDRSRKQQMPFHYVQVTKRQQRQHPHSHLISTFCPDDAIETHITDRHGNQIDVLVSSWFVARNVSAGLGNQCQIQAVRNPVGIGSYIAKYLFKQAIKEQWPPKWKRVRYSRKWPKLLVEKPEVSFALFRVSDWRKMDDIGVQVYTDNPAYIQMGRVRGLTCIRLRLQSEIE